MTLSGDGPGWTRDESDHVKICIVEVLGRTNDSVPIDQLKFELDRTEMPSALVTQMLDELIAAGMAKVAERRNGGRGSYAITEKGRQYLTGLRARRGDLVGRNRAVRAAVLDWLYEMRQQGQPSPVIVGFSDDPRSRFEGEPVTQGTIDEATMYLRDQGLIAGSGSWGGGVLRPRLTSEGIDCVEHFGGDIQAWKQGTRLGMNIQTGGGDYINQSNNVQTMKNSPGGQQAQGGSAISTAEASEVHELAARLRQLVQLPDVDPQHRDQLAALLDELDETASRPNADPAAVRSVWDKVKTVLEAAGPSLNWVLTNMLLPAVLG